MDPNRNELLGPQDTPHSIQMAGAGAFQGLFDVDGFDAAMEKSQFSQEELLTHLLSLVRSPNAKEKATGISLLHRIHRYAEQRLHQSITVTSRERITEDHQGTSSIERRFTLRGTLQGVPEACRIIRPVAIIESAEDKGEAPGGDTEIDHESVAESPTVSFAGDPGSETGDPL